MICFTFTFSQVIAPIPTETSNERESVPSINKEPIKFLSLPKKTIRLTNKNNRKQLNLGGERMLKDQIEISKHTKNLGNHCRISMTPTIHVPAKFKRTAAPTNIASRPPSQSVNKAKPIQTKVANTTKKFSNNDTAKNFEKPSDDDDCILVEEQNVVRFDRVKFIMNSTCKIFKPFKLNVDKPDVTSDNSDSSIKLLSGHPSSISAKVSKAGDTNIEIPVRIEYSMNHYDQF